MPIISALDEHGSYEVVFDVDEEEDLQALYSSMTFCPDKVRLRYTWFSTEPWKLGRATVIGYRRLTDGSLGKERKKCDRWDSKNPQPSWLVQLVGRFRPTDRDGLGG
jgi:hypothetical protein